jgi:putative NIF3 family GTP cyclohydrolase 1 type 2
MKAQELYDKLEKDFIKPGFTDDWAQYLKSIADFLTDNFKKRSMGLVCDFAKEINKVYTAVFPSEKVMKEILDRKEYDAMLFVHHPSVWDIRRSPNVFTEMSRDLLEKFKEMRISVYNLHVPLDNYGEYSTAHTLAEKLGIKNEKPFGSYSGSLAGVFGKTDLKNIQELKEKFESILGHKIALYKYGDDEIRNGIVAVIGGGGNVVDFLQEILKADVNTLITGVSLKNDYSKEAHEFAEKNKINILGGTHYSTEKFACIKICEYFKGLGLEAEFIPDEPTIEDM